MFFQEPFALPAVAGEGNEPAVARKITIEVGVPGKQLVNDAKLFEPALLVFILRVAVSRQVIPEIGSVRNKPDPRELLQPLFQSVKIIQVPREGNRVIL